MYVYTYICTYTDIYICIYTNICIYIYTYIYICSVSCKTILSKGTDNVILDDHLFIKKNIRFTKLPFKSFI